MITEQELDDEFSWKTRTKGDGMKLRDVSILTAACTTLSAICMALWDYMPSSHLRDWIATHGVIVGIIPCFVWPLYLIWKAGL